MIDPAVFICAPIELIDFGKIYPPTVRDVVANPHFSTYAKILTLSQEDIDEEQNKTPQKNERERITPLEFLLNCCYHNKEFQQRTEEAFMLFTHKKVKFLYLEKAILFKDCDENDDGLGFEINEEDAFLSEKTYFRFQNEIRKVMGLPTLKEPEPFNPHEDPRIRRMKEKMRERDRIKAKQASEGKKTGSGISLQTTLAAICCMGIGITPLNIGELSYASIGPIMDMMQEKEKYDLDIRSILAGADAKKIKPKYWIREKDD